MEIWNWKKNIRKSNKNRFGEGLGLYLGRVWSPLGPLLRVSVGVFTASWLFFGRSKSNSFQALVQNGLQEGFWMDFGSLWEGFGKVLGGFGKKFCTIWDLLNT